MPRQQIPIVTGLQPFDQTNIPYVVNENTGSPPTGFSYISTSVRRDAGPGMTNMIIWSDNAQASYATQRPAIKRSELLSDTGALQGDDFAAAIETLAPTVYYRLDEYVSASGDICTNSGSATVASVYTATTTVPVDSPALISNEWRYAKTFGTDTTARVRTTDNTTATQNAAADGFSFVCMFQPTSSDLSSVHIIMSRGARTAGIGLYTSGTSLIFRNGTGATITSTHAALVAGTTYFVACRHASNAGTETVSIDVGTAGGTIQQDTTTSSTRDTATAQTGIGQIAAGTGTEDWHGVIDNAAFWTSELTDANITTLYGKTLASPLPVGSGHGRGVIRVDDKEIAISGAVISGLVKRAGGVPVTQSVTASTLAKVPDGNNKIYMDRIDNEKVVLVVPNGEGSEYSADDNKILEYDNGFGSSGQVINHTHNCVNKLGITLAKGVVFLNGRVYILTTSGDLYNSAEGDLTSWNALDVINAERYFDGGQFIAKHHDHIVVFGERSIEFFYDNGNPTASPLSRRQDLFYTVGIVGEVTQIEDTLYFVGVSEGNDFALYKLENFQIQKISDERVNGKIEALSLGSDPLILTGFSIEARHLIHIGQINTTTSSGVTTATTKENFIYDVKYGAIYDWSSTDTDLDPFLIDTAVSGGCITHQGTLIQFRPVLATTAEDDPSADADDDGIPASPVAIAWEIVSPNFTLGSNHRKFWREIGVEGTFGYRQSSADPVDIEISWSDNFYGSFNTARTIDFSNYKFNVKATGSSQQRAFKLASDTKAKVYLQNWVLNFTEGTH